MGLPLFITPVEPEVSAKSAEKATAASRSSIRRQRTVRGPHSRPSAEIRRRMLGMLADGEPDEYEPPESRPRASTSELARELNARRSWFEQERMRLRDTLSFERQHPPSDEIDGPLLPPVPESRDFSGNDERQREIMRLRAIRHDLRRIARRRPAPTPPYAERDNDLPNLARPIIDSSRPSSFAPARSPPLQSTVGDASPRRPIEDSDFSFTVRGPPYAERAARSTLSERVQALNRVSSSMEQSRRIIRQARLDGLGDRDRSLSPENGAAWDTLLTSITPDPQPPSAGSSFASAVAAASSSGSAPTSASTSMTSVNRDDELPHLRDCDMSDSGSNSDEEEEEDIYELQDFSRIRGDRFWRTYADVVNSRADRAARNPGTDTEHLGGMHRIISRLASRDEIPDEWWASAGLSRNLRREPTT